MRKNQLLATVAMSALIGCTSLAMAQNAGTESQPPGGAVHSQGAPQPQKVAPAPGGGAATQQPQKGAPAPSGGAANQQPQKGAPAPSSGAANHEQQPGGTMNPGGSAQKTNPAGNAQNQLPQSTPEQKSSGEQHPNKSMSQDEQPNKSNKSMSQEEERNKSTQRGVETERAPQERGTGVTGNEQRQDNTARSHEQRERAAVKLSQDQRTKIKDVVVRDRDVARLPSASFSVSVGAMVPRTVHVRVLPSDVVTIVPEYRGFDYIIIGDQLLIIDPVTMEIVAILPA
jgi:hypothetical protein